jgi:elongation factor P
MMIASDIREGMTIRLDGKLRRVLEVVRHSGTGQTHGFVELLLLDLEYAHESNHHVKPGDKLDVVDLQKRNMDFLYHDGGEFHFMDPDSFEQYAVPAATLGPAGRFLLEGMRVTVELLDQAAVAVRLPRAVELRIDLTGPGLRGTQDSTMKSARLQNGIDILVPQFIETGDLVRVDPERGRYMDRVTQKHV